MSDFDADTLAMFCGTTDYYRLTPGHLLTEGAQYLAENAGAYWLMDAIASHLTMLHDKDSFMVALLTVEDMHAILRITDGGSKEYARQTIPYTDFPLSHIKLYCQKTADEDWVLMLPSEY